MARHVGPRELFPWAPITNPAILVAYTTPLFPQQPRKPTLLRIRAARSTDLRSLPCPCAMAMEPLTAQLEAEIEDPDEGVCVCAEWLAGEAPAEARRRNKPSLTIPRACAVQRRSSSSRTPSPRRTSASSTPRPRRSTSASRAATSSCTSRPRCWPPTAQAGRREPVS